MIYKEEIIMNFSFTEESTYVSRHQLIDSGKGDLLAALWLSSWNYEWNLLAGNVLQIP